MRQINEATERPLTLPPKAAPAPAPKPAESWKKTETPGVEINQDGKRRTRIPFSDMQCDAPAGSIAGDSEFAVLWA